MTKRLLKEYWCQEKLDFCQGDGNLTETGYLELIELMKKEILDSTNINTDVNQKCLTRYTIYL